MPTVMGGLPVARSHERRSGSFADATIVGLLSAGDISEKEAGSYNTVAQAVMKRFVPALLMLLCASVYGQQNRFTQVLLDQDSRALRLHRADGSHAYAPKLESQDSFGKPAVASDGRYVGWLALFPDQGASYSQPLYLTVMDTSNRLTRFRGGFGMVFNWCFSPRGTEVLFQSTFPHGPTPVELEMRRISDGRLLHRLEFPEKDFLHDGEASRHQSLPSWAKCKESTHGTSLLGDTEE